MSLYGKIGRVAQLWCLTSALLSYLVCYGATAQVPDSPNVRLATVLARSLDRNIATERGNIRIIKFGNGGARAGALFFIHGDPQWHRTGAFSKNLRDEEARVLANHLEWLRSIAARTNLATYFVARTGVFGSDGETLEFRREDSYLSIGHAIDTVIARDAVRHAAIIGHSGGAAVALYHAIALPSAAARCYALASGVYNIGAMAEFLRLQRQKDIDIAAIDRRTITAVAFAPMTPDEAMRLKYFEPLFRVGDLSADPARQIFAIANRRDTTAPYFASVDLVERVKKQGHRAALVEAAAKPPTYHYTYDTSVETALSCLADKR